ncbi:MAG: DnaD domain protein [Lachnospiraceae bacterium]|nr:DnaD domain protein [Lachnospiraceae bacterium]
MAGNSAGAAGSVMADASVRAAGGVMTDASVGAAASVIAGTSIGAAGSVMAGASVGAAGSVMADASVGAAASRVAGVPATAEGSDNTVVFYQQKQPSLPDPGPAAAVSGSAGAGWVADLEPEPDPYAKPAYSADQLRNFKEQESTAQLLFVAQVYVGRTLTASDMKTILYLSDVLRFSDDLIDYLIQYCVDRGKKDFRYMEKVAVSWAQQGITTPKQAQKAALKYDKSVYAIMNELGKSSAPTTKELEYINRWTREYGFSPDIIFEACERTVMAVDKHRFEYAEGILSSWRKENVHHKADIKRVDEQHQKQKNTAPNTAARNTAAVSNKFNQFKQNTYNFEELEKELLSN